VTTKPQVASVNILNIQDEFVQGMELPPGKYHLEISAEGYETKREWVTLEAGDEKACNYNLSPKLKSSGRLYVTTKPQIASVNILNIQDEFTQGMELPPGKYHLEVSAEGYEANRQWIDIGAGVDLDITIELTRGKAHLWVDTDPEDVTVELIDYQGEFAQGMELEPGKYHVAVSADGYETSSEVVELRPGDDKHIIINLSIELPPIPEPGMTSKFTGWIKRKAVIPPAATKMTSKFTEWVGDQAKWAKDEVTELVEKKTVVPKAARKLPGLIKHLEATFEAQNFEVQVLDILDEGVTGKIFQMKPEKRWFSDIKNLAALGIAATAKLIVHGQDLEIEVGGGKWWDKAVALGSSYWLVVPLFTMAYGSWEQHKLLGELYQEIMEYL
jgi:hypothetical protein